MIHFCDVPSEALCGECLSENGWKKFYNNTTNTFAHVTCLKCRQKVREQKLQPGGFADPPEWRFKTLLEILTSDHMDATRLVD